MTLGPLAPNIVTAICCLAALCTVVDSAKPVIVILGSNAYKEFKQDVAEKFIPADAFLNGMKETRSDFISWSPTRPSEPLDMVQHIHAHNGNMSEVLLSKHATDQCSLEHLQIIYDTFAQEKPLMVVEFGEAAIQTLALLNKGALCWAQSRLLLPVENRVYLCNDLQVDQNNKHIVQLGQIEKIATDDIEFHEEQDDEPRPFWPCLFASAAKASRRRPEVEEIEVQEDEEDEQQIPPIVYEDDDKDKKVELTSDETRSKLACKYRKSCYETGELPEIGKEQQYTAKEAKKEDTDQTKDTDDDDDDDEEVSLSEQKLRCKYRRSCYRNNNIPISEEDEEKDNKAASFFSGKKQVVQGPKRTIKDVATKMLQKVKDREEEAAEREIPTNIIVEKKLNKIEEEMNRKLQCKYRKSCYETGELPEIELAYHIPFYGELGGEAAEEEEKEQVPFEELEELDKKVFCKYRKSCYETGVVPPIIREESYDTIEDILEVETKKISIQEKCKYRKSCYETGIVPDLKGSEPVIVSKKQVEDALPTSVAALKHFCKYRKSCYEEIALSDGVTAVKNIREKRIVKKELKKRAHRRHGRRRNTLRDGEEYHRKATRKEKAMARKERRLVKEAEDAAVRDAAIEAAKMAAAAKAEEARRAAAEAAEAERREEEVMAREKAEEEMKREEPKKQVKKKKGAKKTDVSKETSDTEEQDEHPAPVVSEPVVESKKAKKSKKAKPQEPEPEEEKVEEKEPEVEQKRPQGKKTKKAAKVPVVVQEEEETQQHEPEPLPKDEPVEKEAKPQEKTAKKHKKDKKKEDEDAKPQKEDIEEPKPTLNADNFESLDEQRLFCKYRKSCYETGVAPDLSRNIHDVIEDFNRHVEEQYKTELQKHISEEDKKLSCKYRKSCYDTGVLPKIEIKSFKEAIEENPPSFEDTLSIQMKCKYRKSCYAKHGLKADQVDENEEKDTPQAKKIAEEKLAEKKAASKVAAPQQEDSHKDKKKRKEERREHREQERDDEKEHAQAEEAGSYEDLRAEDKQRCKYRKSCYATAPAKATQEDHAATMARQHGQKRAAETVAPKREKCHKYWISCREQLGLPPLEKAPIGPNGKRLCRKKPKPE